VNKSGVKKRPEEGTSLLNMSWSNKNQAEAIQFNRNMNRHEHVEIAPLRLIGVLGLDSAYA
jgi:hypothetical protein